jgi:hypothetical protein
MTGNLAKTTFALSIERQCILCLAYTRVCGVEVRMKPMRIIEMRDA